MKTESMMTGWYTRAATKGVASLQLFRRPCGQLKMTTTNSSSSSSNHDDLDAIFKQKRILRTQVKKTLKSIDPSLRSQQGRFTSCFLILQPSIFQSSLEIHLGNGSSLCQFSVFSDNAIQDIILGAPWFKSSARLCAYISCSVLREVDTSKLLSEILQPSAATGMYAFSYNLQAVDFVYDKLDFRTITLLLLYGLKIR